MDPIFHKGKYLGDSTTIRAPFPNGCWFYRSVENQWYEKKVDRWKRMSESEVPKEYLAYMLVLQ